MGLPDAWEPGFGESLNKLYARHPKNLDHNSGNLLGISICQVSALNGRRVTAAGAYLSDIPPNLTILTDAAVERVLFEGHKAVGVALPGKKSKLVPPIIAHQTRLAYSPV